MDDIDGTINEEKIYHMAGAKTPQQVAREELVKAIRETGREPVQRDSLYKAVNGEGRRAMGDGSEGETTATGTVAPRHRGAGASNEGGAA